jgi:SRSO17 transposase
MSLEPNRWNTDIIVEAKQALERLCKLIPSEKLEEADASVVRLEHVVYAHSQLLEQLRQLDNRLWHCWHGHSSEVTIIKGLPK